MRITDAHHHLWVLDHLHYPWLTTAIREVAYDDYSAIRRDYLRDDYRNGIGALPVTQSVHVQADCDSAQAVAETEWLHALAMRPDAGGLPTAVVAFVDLAQPEAATALKRQAAFGCVRGIQQRLHAGPARNHLALPAWQANLASLAERRLSFDLQITPDQMSAAAGIARANPDIQFVLGHCGCPFRIRPDWFHTWCEAIRPLAALPNVAAKLSRFGMFYPAWTAASARPVFDHLVTLFGPERCMFASNFPVDRLMASYPSVWCAFGQLARGLPPEDQAALFHGTAERVYRLHAPVLGMAS